MFAENDGTKEGRKAERDRRRADHLKDQNVLPKTPEEIAEMERKRRERMHEEAEKWNMASEDAGNTGDFTDEEEDIYEEGYFEEEDVDSDNSDNGDDVMDLD